MKYFKVKNLEKFQHYKNRKPPWIKLYFTLLGNREFGYLNDASKFHLIAIMLLASQHDNVLPNDSKWLANRIQASDKIDLKPLQTFGFIEEIEVASDMLADCKQLADGETETETETYKEETEVESEEIWLSALRVNKTYSGINIDTEFGKMTAWCEVHNKIPTKRRFINWLNRVDKPMVISESKPVDDGMRRVPKGIPEYLEKDERTEMPEEFKDALKKLTGGMTM